ncbi:MAG: hypothetical protein LEGION0398_MBIBDBAK_01124 [Legionellaceae bacterium]
MPNKNTHNNSMSKILYIVKKYFKRTSQFNDSVNNGIDTAYTPIRVAYWFNPEGCAFLWDPAVIGGEFSIIGLFALVFVIKDHLSRQRQKQLSKYSFVANQLRKGFKASFKHGAWYDKSFTTEEEFATWFKSLDEDLTEDLYKTLGIKQSENSDADDRLNLLLQKLIDAKYFSADQSYPNNKTLTIKKLLTWIPKDLQTQGEKVTEDYINDLFDNEIESKKNNKITIPDPAQYSNEDTENKSSRLLKLKRFLTNKRLGLFIPEDLEIDSKQHWSARGLHLSLIFLKFCKWFLWDIIFIKLIWELVNKYTMGYWVTRGTITVGKKPKELNGSLVDDTKFIFLFPIVGDVLWLGYQIFKGLKTLIDISYEEKANRSGYTLLPEKENVTLDTLNNAQKKQLNRHYFEEKMFNLLKLKNKLQHFEFIQQLKDKDDVDYFELEDFRNKKEKFLQKISARNNLDELKNTSNYLISNIQLEYVSAEQIKYTVLRDTRVEGKWNKLAAFLGGKRAKVFAASTAAGVGMFSAISFIFWILEQAITYGKDVNYLNQMLSPAIKGILIPLIPNWMATSFTVIGGPSPLALLGLGLSITLGIITAYRTYRKTITTHNAMAKKFEKKEVKDALTILSKKQNKLKKLQLELKEAQILEQKLLQEYNQDMRDSSQKLKERDWVTSIPDFVTFDALNYDRFNQTLSFKTSLKTYLKKGLNRALSILMGGISGTFVARMFFSIIKALAVGSLFALFATNPALAGVLTAIFIVSTLFFAAIRVWNYHLDRIKTEQTNFISLITQNSDEGNTLSTCLNRQIKLCKSLKEQSAEKMARIAIKMENSPHYVASSEQEKPKHTFVFGKNIFNSRNTIRSDNNRVENIDISSDTSSDTISEKSNNTNSSFIDEDSEQSLDTILRIK